MQRSKVVLLLVFWMEKQVSKNHSLSCETFVRIKGLQIPTIDFDYAEDQAKKFFVQIDVENLILQQNCILQKNKARG